MSEATADDARKRQQFDEADQERVYMGAHGAQRQGRLGLGQGSGPLRIEGVVQAALNAQGQPSVLRSALIVLILKDDSDVFGCDVRVCRRRMAGPAYHV
jgi:hypothetical protein